MKKFKIFPKKNNVLYANKTDILAFIMHILPAQATHCVASLGDIMKLKFNPPPSLKLRCSFIINWLVQPCYSNGHYTIQSSLKENLL